jgi:hypothetical protein
MRSETEGGLAEIGTDEAQQFNDVENRSEPRSDWTFARKFGLASSGITHFNE